MNAKQARAKAIAKNQDEESSALNKLRKAIDETASKGGFHVILDDDGIPEGIIKKLRKEGYTVRQWQDQRDGDGIQISW